MSFLLQHAQLAQALMARYAESSTDAAALGGEEEQGWLLLRKLDSIMSHLRMGTLLCDPCHTAFQKGSKSHPQERPL